MTSCDNITQGNSCPCTYEGCSRHGKCCECLRSHLAKKQLPACCFSAEAEKTYDRSFAKFVEDQGLGTV